RFGRVNIRDAREEGGLDEAAGHVPARAHAELGDLLAGLAQGDEGHLGGRRRLLGPQDVGREERGPGRRGGLREVTTIAVAAASLTHRAASRKGEKPGGRRNQNIVIVFSSPSQRTGATFGAGGADVVSAHERSGAVGRTGRRRPHGPRRDVRPAY